MGDKSYALIAQGNPEYLLPFPLISSFPALLCSEVLAQLAIGRKLGGGLRTKLLKPHVSVGLGLFLDNSTGTFIRDNNMYHRPGYLYVTTFAIVRLFCLLSSDDY